jgi:hypothetical protein
VAGAARAADSVPAAALPKQSSHIKDVLRGEAKPDGLFDQYFQKYFFVQFSKPTKPNSIDDLPRLRRELRNYFISCHSSEAYKKLTDMTMSAMQLLLRGKHGTYDYAIKYNALLTIGELNEDPEKSGKGKPSAAAFTFLLKVLLWKSAPDYWRVAALYGIERQAAAGTIPKGSAGALSAELLKMVEQKQPPAGRDAAANQYLRRSAAQVLAVIGDPGPNERIVKAIEAVVADPDAKLTMRCEMAQLLGEFKYPKSAESDVQRIAWMATHLAVDLCKQQLESADSPGRAPSRRMIQYAIDTAMRTLGEGRNGLIASVSGTPTQKSISAVYQKLKAISSGLEDPDEPVDAELGSKLAEVETLLNSQQRERGQTAHAR